MAFNPDPDYRYYSTEDVDNDVWHKWIIEKQQNGNLTQLLFPNDTSQEMEKQIIKTMQSLQIQYGGGIQSTHFAQQQILPGFGRGRAALPPPPKQFQN